MQNEDLKKEIEAQMKKKETEALLSGLEKVKKIAYHHEPFSMANDLLTPTFKVKRNAAKKAFQKEIDAMYEGA